MKKHLIDVCSLPIKHTRRIVAQTELPADLNNTYMLKELEKTIYQNQIHMNYRMKAHQEKICFREFRPTIQRREVRKYLHRKKHRIMAEEFCNHVFWAYNKYVPLSEIKKRKD